MYVKKIECQKDVADLIDIFENSWSLSTIDELLHSLKTTNCILCFENVLSDMAVGYAFYVSDARGWVELTDIAVRKESQGNGYGAALIEFLKRYQKPVKLFVEATNPAKNLYDKMGFKVVQEISNFYTVGQDAFRVNNPLIN